MIGRETVRASMLAEVAEQLDAACIETVSLMVTAEDMVVVSIPNLGDYHRALKMFNAGPGNDTWRGVVVRIHVGRRALVHSGGDAA